MFNLTEWKQTRFYQEAKEEGQLNTVPLLLKLGLTPEQIAEELKINIEKIRQFIASHNN
jgi:predicted transposase YdaD